MTNLNRNAQNKNQAKNDDAIGVLRPYRQFTLWLLFSLFLTACGGGGGGDNDATTNTENGSDVGNGLIIDETANGSDGDNDVIAGDTRGSDGENNGDIAEEPENTNESDNDVATRRDEGALTLNNKLEMAISLGDPRLLEGDDELLMSALITEFAALEQSNQSVLNTIYQNSTIDYSPAQNSQFIYSSNISQNFSLIKGNKGYPLASAGENSTGRYAAFGTKVYSMSSYSSTLDNLLKWLIKDTNIDSKKVAFSYMKSAAKNWGDANYVDWNTSSCNDITELGSCFENKDLIIVGSALQDSDASQLADAIKVAMDNGVAILYMHTNGRNPSVSGSAVLKKMDMYLGGTNGNFFPKDKANYTNISEMIEISNIAAYHRLLQHFKYDDFNIDYTGCAKSKCSSVSYMAEFGNAAQDIFKNLSKHDSANRNIFNEDGRKLEKMLVLLGDVYRRDVVYPMNKNTTPSKQFLSAIFADKTRYNSRSINPAQVDLGDFSKPVDSNVPRNDVSVNFDINSKGGFSSLGYYAHAGETVTITRTDSNPLSAKVFINSMRTGSSRTFDTYKRPTNIRSTQMRINTGNSITFTSAIGGVIFVSTGSSSENSVMSFDLKNVGSHLVYTTSMSAQEFANKLATTPYSWVDIKTPYVEIHSKVSRMKQSLSNAPYNGDIDKLLTYLQTYMVEDTYNLAGFYDAGLSLNTNVKDVCIAKGLNCESEALHGLPKIQHINVDLYAHCGSGCAGNPYDQSWALDPAGWGETHEIGHNLQRTRLKIYNKKSIEVSNQIFPIHKIQSMNDDLGFGKKRSMKDKELFTFMQSVASDSDSIEQTHQYVWLDETNSGRNKERMSFFTQVVYHNDDNPAFATGWDAYTLMYLLEREFTKISSSNWAANKDRLGFSTYTSKPNIDGNDFMLISLSYVSEKDFRVLFDLFGITYSAKANTQLDAFGYTSVNKEFFIRDDSNVFAHPVYALPIDGTSVWPL